MPIERECRPGNTTKLTPPRATTHISEYAYERMPGAGHKPQTRCRICRRPIHAVLSVARKCGPVCDRKVRAAEAVTA